MGESLGELPLLMVLALAARADSQTLADGVGDFGFAGDVWPWHVGFSVSMEFLEKYIHTCACDL